MPRFSVVIPTRNRPLLLKIAVKSLLRQTFDDWELVLSDNSTNEDTRAMMAGFDDPRIRYLRADDLSMCDNWEFACAHAQGEYVCVLEDKQAMKLHALERVDEVLREQQADVVRWQWESLEPYGLGHRIRRHGPRGGIRSLGSDDVLDLLVEGNYLDGKFGLPIPHYCAIRRTLLDEIRRGAVGRLFPPVAPDYTLAIQILNFCDHLVYIDEGLVTFSDVQASNGVSIVMKTQPGKDFVASLGGEQVFYDHVPVKALTISGAIHNDYVRLRKRLGGRLERHPPNWANYFLACFDDIRSSMELGVDMSDELAETERALAEQPTEIRAAVAEGRARSRRRKNSWSRRLRKSRPVLGLSRGAKSVLHGRLLKRDDWRFNNIEDYLEHEAAKRVALKL